MARSRVVAVMLLLVAVVVAGFVLYRSHQESRDEPQIFYPCGKDEPDMAITLSPAAKDGPDRLNVLCDD